MGTPATDRTVGRFRAWQWGLRYRLRSFLSGLRWIVGWRWSWHLWGDIGLRYAGNAYGGGWIAVGLLRPGSRVYSVGVGEDVSFDVDLHRMVPCRITGVDPTPRAIEFVRRSASSLPPGYALVPAGLAAERGTRRFFFPRDPAHVSLSLTEDSGRGFLDCEVVSLQDLMARLEDRFVDLLKIDVEGAEYELLSSWIRARYCPPVGQIWVEFHEARAGKSPEQTKAILAGLRALGFAGLADGVRGALLVNIRQHAVPWRERLRFMRGEKLECSSRKVQYFHAS